MAIHDKDRKIFRLAAPLRPLRGSAGRFAIHCARLPAVEGPERAPGVLTGVRSEALRTVAGNGSARDGIRCAYRCPVEGIAHGCRRLRGLRGLPVCLPVSG